MSSELDTYKETTDKDDEGLTIPRIRIPPPSRLKDASRFIINNVNLTIEQGYSDEQLDVHLSLSKDGAQSFGTKWSKTLNPMGKRANKLLYRKLGSANDVSFQFQFWGKDRFIVTDAEMEVYQ